VIQYDYPTDITESVSDVGQQAASAWSTFANKNLKVRLLSLLPEFLVYYLSPAARAEAK
jgi:hypothetical protein